jgi:hypothetical protein
MQFADMGLYITGLLALQWGIPRSSIPYIVGGTNTKDDTGGNAERGYWQFIKGVQMTFAEIWNTQLWMPHFGVKIVFENQFPQLDVQEAAAMQSKIQNLQNIDTLLMKDKKMISYEKKLEVLGLTEEDIDDAPEDALMAMQGGLNIGTPKTSNDKPNTDQAAGKAGAKRQEQQNTIASRGKPTGYGKEIDELKESIIELKGFIAGTIQSHVRKDAPVQQFVDNGSSHVGAQDSALITDNYGPSFPDDWSIKKDNKTGWEKQMPQNPQGDNPAVPPQKSFAPGNMINNSNMDNPAGNVNYSGNFHRDEGGFVANDTEQHDVPNVAQAKKKGNYPTQRKYPDEPMQLPGKNEPKEANMSAAEKAGYIEESHEHPGFPPESIMQIVKDHLSGDPNYYSKKEIKPKTMDNEAKIELKNMFGIEMDDVDLNTFVKLYSEDKTYHPGKSPRIFYKLKEGVVTLKFKSNDFVYRCICSEEKVRSNPILMMNLPSMYEL